jgi:hypothetical protein
VLQPDPCPDQRADLQIAENAGDEIGVPTGRRSQNTLAPKHVSAVAWLSGIIVSANQTRRNAADTRWQKRCGESEQYAQRGFDADDCVTAWPNVTSSISAVMPKAAMQAAAQTFVLNLFD